MKNSSQSSDFNTSLLVHLYSYIFGTVYNILVNKTGKNILDIVFLIHHPILCYYLSFCDPVYVIDVKQCIMTMFEGSKCFLIRESENQYITPCLIS